MRTAALILALAAGPANAQPVAVVTAVPVDAVVLDARAETACLEASLPGARCMPGAWVLVSDAGGPVGFHALRWLLGTVGLRGDEAVVIHGEDDSALAVAAMLHLAGQASVAVLLGPTRGLAEGGESRSFSREVVYTAPMRLEGLGVGSGQVTVSALVAYARQGGRISFPAIEEAL